MLLPAFLSFLLWFERLRLIFVSPISLKRIEDKGKEYGSYVKSGGFRWFVRETGNAQHITCFFSGNYTIFGSFLCRIAWERAWNYCVSPRSSNTIIQLSSCYVSGTAADRITKLIESVCMILFWAYFAHTRCSLTNYIKTSNVNINLMDKA